MIEGLSHITLISSDIDCTAGIILKVLGGREIYRSGKRQFSVSAERFYHVAGIWIAVMEGTGLDERTYNHIAFKIPDEAIETCCRSIEELGLEFRPPRPRVLGEGRSVYFYDHDNHLFELHSGTLQERLQRYAEEVDA